MKTDKTQTRRVTSAARTLGILGLGLALIGCSNIALQRMTPSNVSATVRPDIRKYNLRNIAVMPFRNNTDSPEAGHKVAAFFYHEMATRKRYSVTPPVRLDLTEEIELEFRVDPSRRAGTVNREENLRLLGRAVSNYLKQVAPYTTTESLVFSGETPAKSPDEDSGAVTGEIRSSAVKPGEESQALDAVVTGVITRYRNRDGTPLTADHPSSVSFDVFLISVHDGKILWSATFEETQEFLSENLLLLPRFLEGGGLWQSNDKLARIGMARVLDTFPGIAKRIRAGVPGPPEASAAPEDLLRGYVSPKVFRFILPPNPSS